MANNRPNHQGHSNRPPRENREPRENGAAREYFTLGDHTVGSKYYRFRYDGRTYRILTRAAGEAHEEDEEQVLLEEADSRKAYDAWNHIKRPERFGSM